MTFATGSRKRRRASDSGGVPKGGKTPTVCLAKQMSQRSNKLKSFLHCHRSCLCPLYPSPPLALLTTPLLLLLHVHFVVQRRENWHEVNLWWRLIIAMQSEKREKKNSNKKIIISEKSEKDETNNNCRSLLHSAPWKN